MLFFNEACKLAAACGASFMLASVWMLVQRLASAHIRYVTAKALRMELASENLRVKQSQQNCCEAVDVLPCSEAPDTLSDSQNPVTRRSIINFYLAHGRRLNPLEIDSLVELERYRCESNLNMSNLKIFDYVLGEFTEKPLKNVLIANDILSDNVPYTKDKKILCKNNMIDNGIGDISQEVSYGAYCDEIKRFSRHRSFNAVRDITKNKLLKNKENNDVEDTKSHI